MLLNVSLPIECTGVVSYPMYPGLLMLCSEFFILASSNQFPREPRDTDRSEQQQQDSEEDGVPSLGRNCDVT